MTGTGELKKRIPMCRSIIAAVSEAKADIHISEGEFIKFGKFKLECRSTPGHTNGNDTLCLTYSKEIQSTFVMVLAMLV